MKRVCIGFTVFALALATGASSAQGQDDVQASLLFERGNQLLERGLASRGPRRERLLQDALSAYLESFDLTPNPNVAFNTGICLEAIDRPIEAHAFFSRYLTFEGLTAEDRDAGRSRLEALRPRVAVVSVTSDPPGAELRIGQRAVPASGRTPLEVAIAEGHQQLFLSLPGYEDLELAVTGELGARWEENVTLTPRPVSLTIEGPPGETVSVGGNDVTFRVPFSVEPGEYLIVYRSHEDRVQVSPGTEPVVFTPRFANLHSRGTVRVVVDRTADVRIDGTTVGRGTEVEAEVVSGPHTLEVSEPGYRTARSPMVVPAWDSIEARASLSPAIDPGSSLGALPEITLITAGTIGLVAVGFAAAAFVARDDFDEAQGDVAVDSQTLRDLRQDVVTANTAADVLGFTALGTLALGILFALIDEPLPEAASSIQLAATPWAVSLVASVEAP